MRPTAQSGSAETASWALPKAACVELSAGNEPTAPSAKDRELSVKTRPAAAQMFTTNRCAQEEILRPDT